MQKVTIKVEGMRGDKARGTFIVERRQRDIWNRQSSKDIGLDSDATQEIILQDNERLVFEVIDVNQALAYDPDQAAAINPNQQKVRDDRADKPMVVPPEGRPPGGPLSPPSKTPAPGARTGSPTGVKQPGPPPSQLGAPSSQPHVSSGGLPSSSKPGDDNRSVNMTGTAGMSGNPAQPNTGPYDAKPPTGAPPNSDTGQGARDSRDSKK